MVEIYEKNMRDAGFGLALLGLAFSTKLDFGGEIIFLLSALCFLLIPTVRTISFLYRGER